MSGKFVWYELMTNDDAGAETFYRDVAGWRARDAGMPNLKYTLLTLADAPVAGLVQFPPESVEGQGRPGWLGYLGVDDVDATAAAAEKLGAKLLHAPTDIPDVGRFAVLADPQGVCFALFKPKGQREVPAAMTPGTFGWHELHTTDAEKALGFYRALFGWKHLHAMDIGPLGSYHIFGDESTPMGFGGTFNDPAAQRPFWLFYIAVADIDAAAARVTAAGGKILQGPREVPGGAWVIQGTDPQGALFALVGQRAA